MNNGYIFKSIEQDNHNISSYLLKKDWVFTDNTFAAAGIQIDDISSSDYLYKTIDHLYYATKPYSLSTDADIELSITDNVVSLGIPQIVYGEKIEPDTFELTYDDMVVTDDGHGNLNGVEGAFDSIHVGNIFYENGNIIIIDTGSFYSGFDSSSVAFELGFKGNHTIYEHEVQCLINKNEFNNTLNASAYSGSYGISDIYNYPGSWTPYITTIGLYDESNNLLATGKLAKPIKNISDMDLTFIVKFDV